MPKDHAALIEYLLEDFDANHEVRKNELKNLVVEISGRLDAVGIHPIVVTGRIKERQSFERKLRKRPTRPIEDLVGLRIVVLVDSEIQRVERVIRGMFRIEDSSWVDKAATRDPSVPGYRSRQMVATRWPLGYGSDPQDIWNMVESTQKFELQIRTALSHAWAEIEHTRYENLRSTDRAYSRDPNTDRLLGVTAALLQQADANLDEIQRALDGTANLDRGGEWDMEPLRMDAVRFAETNRFSKALDKDIAAALDLPLQDVEKSTRQVITAVQLAGWTTDSALEDAVIKLGSLARRMAIVCTDVTHGLVQTDYHVPGIHDDEPVAFQGIGLYWLGLAVAFALNGKAPGDTPRDITNVWTLNDAPDGRQREYAQVARYLLSHDESALTVRAKYWAVRAPFGAKRNSEYPLFTLE